MSIITRTPARRNTTTRKPLPASPPWLLPVGRYLRALGLDPIQLSEVCWFLTKHGRAQGNMTLSPEHAAEVDRLISGKPARPGDVGTPQHAR